MLQSAPLRAAIGFVFGLALWLLLAPVYNAFVSRAAEIGIGAWERPNVTSLRMLGRDALIHRIDFDPRSPLPKISISDLTFNFVVLTTLFGLAGLERRENRDGHLLLALAILFLGHVAALVTRVMAIYVRNLGPWSLANYGAFERNFWSILYDFYRFVGCYALAFAIWWWLGCNTPALSPDRAKRRTSRPRRAA